MRWSSDPLPGPMSGEPADDDPTEVLGSFTAGLLYAGTATVIASVARVQDDAPVRLMTAYHRRLAAGTAPAEALAASAATEPFSPFACFGSG